MDVLVSATCTSSCGIINWYILPRYVQTSLYHGFALFCGIILMQCWAILALILFAMLACVFFRTDCEHLSSRGWRDRCQKILGEKSCQQLEHGRNARSPTRPPDVFVDLPPRAVCMHPLGLCHAQDMASAAAISRTRQLHTQGPRARYLCTLLLITVWEVNMHTCEIAYINWHMWLVSLLLCS